MNRRVIGWACLALAVIIWIPSGDVVDMIIRQKEIVLGRYSRGHFGAAFLLSLLLIGAAALSFSKLRGAAEMFLVSGMVILSTLISGFILIVGSGIAVAPRYVETAVSAEQDGMQISGVIRHRQPNEFYQLQQIDQPEQQRSYPDAPAGYPAFDLTLTTDIHGFRNPSSTGKLLAEYPIVAVGDSFVAGSHVSDQQAWVSLLAQQLNTDIYNLGVSGSDPGTYLNNFLLLGRQFKPRQVLFMIYEGNDFKDSSPVIVAQAMQANGEVAVTEEPQQPLNEKISYWTEASPVTKGLRRFSAEVLESIGKDKSVPDYAEKVGFMPIRMQTGPREHAYTFEPKRLYYLYQEKESFRQSANWQRVASIMQQMVELGKQDGFSVLFLYAPSTPHVVMPLVQDAIPPEQLRNFLTYQKANLPEADILKKNIFSWINNEQEVFLEYCAAQKLNCLSLTDSLQQATAAGGQMYYTYDQHWTPDGNRVVANVVAAHIK